jgi:DNA polymerase-3 subunit gamma/tau
MKLASITFDKQKKKSKHFIIPASYFLSATIEEKLDVPEKIIKNSGPSVPSIVYIEEEKSEYKKTEEIIIEKQEHKVPEPVKIELKNVIRRKSALSISSIQRNKIEEENLRNKQKLTKNIEELPKESFSEEKFLKVWRSYVESLHNNGEKIFASLLNADTPELNGNLIVISYPNQMMKKELNKVKSKALKHLRKELNNYDIDFKVTVNEENEKNFAYTPQEKYDFLKSKNKSIITLRKTFNLEL